MPDNRPFYVVLDKARRFVRLQHTDDGTWIEAPYAAPPVAPSLHEAGYQYLGPFVDPDALPTGSRDPQPQPHPGDVATWLRIRALATQVAVIATDAVRAAGDRDIPEIGYTFVPANPPPPVDFPAPTTPPADDTAQRLHDLTTQQHALIDEFHGYRGRIIELERALERAALRIPDQALLSDQGVLEALVGEYLAFRDRVAALEARPSPPAAWLHIRDKVWCDDIATALAFIATTLRDPPPDVHAALQRLTAGAANPIPATSTHHACNDPHCSTCAANRAATARADIPIAPPVPCPSCGKGGLGLHHPNCPYF